MIAPATTLADAFVETDVPAGPISDQAADALARLLWAAAGDGEDQAGEQGTGEQEPDA